MKGRIAELLAIIDFPFPHVTAEDAKADWPEGGPIRRAVDELRGILAAQGAKVQPCRWTTSGRGMNSPFQVGDEVRIVAERYGWCWEDESDLGKTGMLIDIDHDDKIVPYLVDVPQADGSVLPLWFAAGSLQPVGATT